MEIRAAKSDKGNTACLGTESRPVLLLFPVLLLLLQGGLSAAGPAASNHGAARPGGGTAVIDPASVKEIGPLLVPQGSSFPVVGQAGNYSVALEGGGSVWTFNNIWTGEVKENGEVALWGIVDGGVAVLETTSPWSAAGSFQYTADENKWPLPLFAAELSAYAPVRKFWPRAAVRTAAGYRVYYSIMNNFGPGGGDYFRVGQGLGAAAAPTGPYVMLKYRDQYAFWSDIEPSFGSALWADPDGWIYVYGRYMTEPGKSAVAVARVRPESVTERESYSYYSLESAFGAWTSDITEASQVMESVPEEFSVAYNEHLKAYLALYSDPEAGNVVVRTAQYPWGPWDAPQAILSCGREDYCFGAKEQPAFASEGGERIFFTLEKKNRPYLYELTLK